MDRSPSARYPLARWTAIGMVLLVAASLAFMVPGARFLFTGQQPAKQDGKAAFEGMWDGSFKDDPDETGKAATGNGKYLFHEEKEGRFDVSVSWNDGKYNGEMKLQGERLGLDAMRLEGKYKQTTYRYLGRMVDGKLVLRYLSIDENGKSGSGVSTLTQPRP
jgi:hypothetical protein